MILISWKQMESVSLGIDIVGTSSLIPNVTRATPSDHHSQSRDWYDVCVGSLSLSAARDRQPRNYC
jgi:hypothetical protein